jgi:hypothetical protein
VGDSQDEARRLFERTRDALDDEARAAALERDLPAVDSALVTS